MITNLEEKLSGEIPVTKEDSMLLFTSKTFVNWLYKNKEMIRDIHTPKEDVMDFFDFNNKDNGIENDK